MKPLALSPTAASALPTSTLPAYEVVYSRRKTIGLIVERDARLVVRAPFGVSQERIAQVVRSKSLWIYSKTHHAPKFAVERAAKELFDGETMLYLGRNYRLEVLSSREGQTDGLEFGGCFRLRGATCVTASAWFRAWYEARGRQWIPRRAARYARAMGASPTGFTVTEVSASWGSCSLGGVLNFNWRLMKAPLAVVDYIIVHELAHLLEANHTARLWNIIAVQLPDYKASREWLAKNGSELERDF